MKVTILLSVVGIALADLRTASQPKQAFKVLQQGGGRGSKNFAAGTGTNLDGTKATGNDKGVIYYIEPSIFGYGGLANQRNKNYDNFLRSNIDNEQDNRNFNNEAGEDHLPFRSMRSGVPTQYPYKGPLPGGADDSLQVNNVNMQTVLTVAPGEPRVTPLRWNNPHASEIEVNLWIMCADPPTIVPVKKPACSGEGNQNNIIEWAIPADFNQANFKACAATACFNGCEKAGDCVLQIYAHSVETRQYTTAVPIVITKNAYAGQKYKYSATPLDAKEAGTGYDWKQPRSYDLKSMVTGKQAGNPTQNVGVGKQAATLTDVKVCASSEREGVNPNGDGVPSVELNNANPYPQLDAGTVHLFLCKNTATQRAAEKLVDRVVFTVKSIADASKTAARTENYPPYEMQSINNFNGAADAKTVQAVLTAYDGSTRTVNVNVDLRGGKRWRFRRHLKAVCQTTNQLNQPFADPWMDLSKLQRETCMSAQDPNSNYATTTIQRARIISDVANHAYQNSNYSPYSGQQQKYISRNLQAAAVVHMTSGNRGELGKANLPNAVKQKLQQLNNAVNQIYKNYEKVANKVIDELTKNGGKNGAGNTMGLGLQQLGESFRSAEKGATSTKRLKTTTYVPSFNTAGYNMQTIQNAIKSRTRGNKAQYADLLTPANAQTGQQYIHIYVKTMDKMLAQFAAAEPLGIHYLPAVETLSCKAIGDQKLAALSAGAGGQQAATPCCTGPITNAAAGGCGATMASMTNHRKRNAQNKQDGGVYAARKFELQRAQTLWNCPEACILQTVTSQGLGTPLTKTSKGTCLTWDSGADGCTATKQTGSTDCSSCIGAYNNVAPTSFSEFTIGLPGTGTGGTKTDLTRSILRVQSAQDPEPLGPVLKAKGQDLAEDDTAVCHTESSFTCTGAKDNMSMEDYEKLVNEGKCTDTASKKRDGMCDDGPCDNEPNSLLCKNAKARCEVDPDSGEKCMPGNENDPCIGCVPIEDGAEVVAVTFTSLLVLASVL